MAVKKATTTDDIKQPAPEPGDGYTVVVGPSGAETTVPDSIVDTLLESGYTRK